MPSWYAINKEIINCNFHIFSYKNKSFTTIANTVNLIKKIKGVLNEFS